jgi:hypothetical protein
MSTEKVAQAAKETIKSVKEALGKAEEATHRALDQVAPALQRSMNSSMEAASKGFSATMRSIDSATSGDQVKLLKAYRTLLSGQMDFVEARIRSIEEKDPSVEPATSS